MNPYLIISAMVAMAGAALGGFQLGVDHERANQIDKQALVAEAVDAANTSAADAISKIKPQYTTLKSEVQREIQTNTVFADCKLPPNSLRIVNQALGSAGVAKPSGGGELPKPDAAQ